MPMPSLLGYFGWGRLCLKDSCRAGSRALSLVWELRPVSRLQRCPHDMSLRVLFSDISRASKEQRAPCAQAARDRLSSLPLRTQLASATAGSGRLAGGVAPSSRMQAATLMSRGVLRRRGSRWLVRARARAHTIRIALAEVLMGWCRMRIIHVRVHMCAGGSKSAREIPDCISSFAPSCSLRMLVRDQSLCSGSHRVPLSWRRAG